MSFLIYLGDPVLLALREFLGFICFSVAVNILKLQGKGLLEGCPKVSMPIVCTAPWLTKGFL